MWFASLLLFVQLVTAEPPPCLDNSQRVPQVRSLVKDSTLSQGFNTWLGAQAVAKYLYLQGVATSPTPSAWLAVGYPNGNFISLEDCSVAENRNLDRCRSSTNSYRYVVQIVAQGVIPGSDKIHGWPFNPANSQVVGNMTDFIYARLDRYVPSTRPWWGVNGWSDIYALENGQGRSFGHYNGDYAIVSAYAPSEGVCPDGIDDINTGLSGGAIAGIVIGVLAFLGCAGCCYRCCCAGGNKNAGSDSASVSAQGTELGYVGKKWPTVKTDSDTADPPAYNDYNKPIWYGSNPALAPEDPANEEHYYSKLLERVSAEEPGAVAELAASPPVDAAPATSPSSGSSEASDPAPQPASVFSANYLANLGPVQFPVSDYAERLDGPTENVKGVPAGLENALAIQPAAPTPGFTENYMENLAPISFPESDYVEQLNVSDVGPQPSYSSYDASGAPPTYY